MTLLIAIPIKSNTQEYTERAEACERSWLQDCPVDYKLFSDANLGLSEADPLIRPKRTQGMCSYALRYNYDYIFRVDADAFVWVNRLLSCGYESHDYMGYCHDYPKHLEIDKGRRTAGGGPGFFLSRKAMGFIAGGKPWPSGDGKYWGDIWTGELLWKMGIYCHRDSRFVDGHGEGIEPADLPANHPYISVHQVSRYDFPPMPTETHPIDHNPWNPDGPYNYGLRRPDICSCTYCHPSK